MDHQPIQAFVLQLQQTLTLACPVDQGAHTPIATRWSRVNDGSDGCQKNNVLSLGVDPTRLAAAVLAPP